jgi:tRNA A37 threonylcarbamoyladenosine biosynthesis protein TsaE
MEWADRWPEILPKRHLLVQIRILNEHSREITFSGTYPEGDNTLDEITMEGS